MYAVVEGTRQAPILKSVERIAAPVDAREEDAIHHLYTRLHLILQSENATAIGVRFPEAIARGSGTNAAKERCRVEGAVLLLARSKGIRVWTGAMKSLGALLEVEKPKEQISGHEFRGVLLSSFAAKEREAIAVAVSQLPE